jgi:hypothetical protein
MVGCVLMDHSSEPATPSLRDGFAEAVSEVEAGTRSDVTLTDLAQRYAYVLPDNATLTMLADLGPLVEIGAGTGYWAQRLRVLGVDIVALDQAPPDGDAANRYHAKTPTWSEVLRGDHTVLSAYADRALFLCWPPLFSALGDCLSFYTGNTVAVIGDGGHRTARIRGLNDTFTRTAMSPVHALEPSSDAAPALTIWRRNT